MYYNIEMNTLYTYDLEPEFLNLTAKKKGVASVL